MLILLFIGFILSSSVAYAFVPKNDRYFVEGKLTLGGLFPIHSTYVGGEKCMDIQGQDGIQAVEAMKYSIDLVNRNGSILPQGVTFGMVGIDTCESETVALDNTNELIESRVNKQAGTDTCSCKSKTVLKNNLIGIIGPASSKLSIPVASLLRLFKVPQISYQSTSPELNDRTRFQYFKRTVPSDNYQARAIAGILKRMRFHYITIVYEDSSYGSNYKSMLEKLSLNGDFCIGTSIKLTYDAPADRMDDVVKNLLNHKNTKGKVVSVLILRPHTTLNLFKAVRKTSLINSFHWVGTDGWAGRMFPDTNVMEVAEGSIGVQLYIGAIPGFMKYFDKEKVNNKGIGYENRRNPWWTEFVDYYSNGECGEHCDLEEFGILHYITDAVFAFAYAIKNMHTEFCNGEPGVCEQLKAKLSTGDDLLSFLSNVTFTDSQGGHFQFVNGSEGPPKYSILGYRFDGRKGLWEIIGNYSRMGDKEDVHFNKTAEKYGDKVPSLCSEPCQFGYAKTVREDRCCWRCTKCAENQYVGPSSCVPCHDGYRANKMKTNCSPVAIEHMDYNKTSAIATLALSSLGITICLFVIGVFVAYRETPIVKATDFKLSLVLIVGLIMSYASSLVFLAKPSVVTCGLTRYLLGVCYTLQYAILLTKTIRIYRLFEAKSPEKKKFVNSRSSMTMMLLLTFIHVLALTLWMIFDRPYTKIDYTENSGVLICSDVENYSYALSLTYSVALLLACVFFAIKTRKIPDGFKETRFISICSYTTCIIWLAFASTFFFTNNNVVRVLSLCITLSINSTVTLCVLFLSRVYIILMKPKMNTRERVMTRANESSHNRTSSCLTSNKCVGTDEAEIQMRNGLLADPSHSTKPSQSDNKTSKPDAITIKNILKKDKKKRNDDNFTEGVHLREMTNN